LALFRKESAVKYNRGSSPLEPVRVEEQPEEHIFMKDNLIESIKVKLKKA
jgi:hypothetical protein